MAAPCQALALHEQPKPPKPKLIETMPPDETLAFFVELCVPGKWYWTHHLPRHILLWLALYMRPGMFRKFLDARPDTFVIEQGEHGTGKIKFQPGSTNIGLLGGGSAKFGLNFERCSPNTLNGSRGDFEEYWASGAELEQLRCNIAARGQLSGAFPLLSRPLLAS